MLTGHPLGSTPPAAFPATTITQDGVSGRFQAKRTDLLGCFAPSHITAAGPGGTGSRSTREEGTPRAERAHEGSRPPHHPTSCPPWPLASRGQRGLIHKGLRQVLLRSRDAPVLLSKVIQSTALLICLALSHPRAPCSWVTRVH